MAFPKSRILSAKNLSQIIKESTENSDQRFCFILGSGASVESGIPVGSTLEMRWMNYLMGKPGDQGMPVMDAEETRRLANALYEEDEMEHKFDEIEAAWRKVKEEGGAISSKYYFDIYKLRFHDNPRMGYRYLEKIMEHSDPSLGYHALAKLLTENNQNNLVITTNFDSLVEDALFLYTDKKPLVVSHESLADYMDANIQRPIVAKVHRGLMYAPLNSPETTNELKLEWQTALNHALNTYTPIVIGYAGGDHSLMSFLEDERTDMRRGVYWCYCGKPDSSDLPEKKIQRFVKKRNGYFVAIDGFDALMVEIGKVMYGDAIRPGLTAEHLKKNYENRVQRYNQQWEKLNEKPEIQEALQEMNEAERHEEEQREKAQTLTVWDYIRRGNRARSEGRLHEAMEEYSEAIIKYPENAGAYVGRGNIYDDLGQYEKAIEDCDKAIELDPNYAMAYYNRGNEYEKIGQHEEAIRDYDKAIELDPNYTDAYYNRGNVYENLGQHEKAIKDYDKAIELAPNDAMAYNNRGVAYDSLGQREKAIKDYDKAIELDPDYAKAYNNRGVVYDDLGQHEKAIKDYDKAIELNPEYKNAYLGRAGVYSAIGEEALAEADRKKAEEL
ncbi:MAG: tetratricopeptide repeat protein [Lachnospiraceae bacterium]|nr:tetratricopeptide repeat protein [Lachnospiraceae bacterium]